MSLTRSELDEFLNGQCDEDEQEASEDFSLLDTINVSGTQSVYLEEIIVETSQHSGNQGMQDVQFPFQIEDSAASSRKRSR